MNNEGLVTRRRKSFVQKHWLFICLVFPVLSLLAIDFIDIALLILERFGYVPFFDGEVRETILRFVVTFILMIFAVCTRLSKKIKFGFKGIGIGFFYGCSILVYAFVVGAGTLFRNALVGNEIVPYYLVILIFLNLSIGFYEEYLFRGIIFETLRMKFPSRSDALPAIFFQAVIFGGLHINNFFQGTLTISEVCVQIIVATIIGFYLGVVYYSSKSLISVILLHAMYDFALMLPYIYEGDNTIDTIITSIDVMFIGIFTLIAIIIGSALNVWTIAANNVKDTEKAALCSISQIDDEVCNRYYEEFECTMEDLRRKDLEDIFQESGE